MGRFHECSHNYIVMAQEISVNYVAM